MRDRGQTARKTDRKTDRQTERLHGDRIGQEEERGRMATKQKMDEDPMLNEGESKIELLKKCKKEEGTNKEYKN